jgi:hypothetical protein
MTGTRLEYKASMEQAHPGKGLTDNTRTTDVPYLQNTFLLGDLDIIVKSGL